VQLKNEIRELKQIRLPWWGLLLIIIGVIPLGFLFDYFRRSTLALPTLDSVVIIIFAFAMRWKLRRHAWFWMTMTGIVALHVLLIVSIPWTSKWVPAIVIIPIGMLDLFAMLAILSVVGKFVGGRQTLKAERTQPHLR
jgi:hypothetical protein